MTTPVSQVLVVGAGPTGLALAAQVHANGGRVRIVERRLGGRESRAFIMQPRTLEVLSPLGIAEELVARGDPSAKAVLHAGGRSARVSVIRPGVEDTAYPFLLAIPQATVEEVLEEHLREQGVQVERGVELTSLQPAPDAVTCELHGPNGRRQRARAAYLVGCDGADSTVRRLAGIPFPGRPYRPVLLLADLEVTGDLEPGSVHGFVGAGGIFFLFPAPGGAATWRLLTVDHGVGQAAGSAPDLPALQAAADRFTGGALTLHDPAWSTAVRLRRGQATRYRAGRVLLAGDAAHVHSPAAAQGMNTGIQDACNLGWKLALVAAGTAGQWLLDSYQAERWPVAWRTRQLTDLAFALEAADYRPLAALRRIAAPLLPPLAQGLTMPRWAFRLLGGLSIGYRASPAAEEGRPRCSDGPRAGDRLGDGRVLAGGTPCWLHERLRPPGFHLLLCGRGPFDPGAADALRRSSPVPLTVHRLATAPRPGVLADPDGRLLARLGATDGAVYLVRPDTYVGYRSRGPCLAGVARHLRFEPGAQP